jgi:nicotinate-nucleotide adenylyltransferase
MAPFEKRAESLLELAGNQPKLKVCDYEAHLGTRYTVDTITALTTELPHTNFVWLMGADNFRNFDRWYKWQDIVRAVPIAVFDRSGYALRGFARGLGNQFGKYRSRFQAFDVTQKPNWTFIAIPRHAGSATDIRARDGENWYAGN